MDKYYDKVQDPPDIVSTEETFLHFFSNPKANYLELLENIEQIFLYSMHIDAYTNVQTFLGHFYSIFEI